MPLPPYSMLEKLSQRLLPHPPPGWPQPAFLAPPEFFVSKGTCLICSPTYLLDNELGTFRICIIQMSIVYSPYTEYKVYLVAQFVWPQQPIHILLVVFLPAVLKISYLCEFLLGKHQLSLGKIRVYTNLAKSQMRDRDIFKFEIELSGALKQVLSNSWWDLTEDSAA